MNHRLLQTSAFSVLAVVVLLLQSLAAVAAEPDIRRMTPRPYGYQLGDVIEHRIIVTTGDDYHLVEESLPKEGSLDYWLELRSVDVDTSSDGKRSVITLEYQVFYASRDVRAKMLPALEIKIANDKQTRTLRLPPWEFTISPLLETMGARYSESGVYLRDDARPLLRTAAIHKTRLTIWLAGLLLLAAAAIGRSFWLRSLRQPFRQAQRQLRRLARTSSTDNSQTLKQGARCVHRAFDRTAGESVFMESLPWLFQQQPALQPLQQRIETFFQQSRELFFAESMPAGESTKELSLAEMKRLCRDCARALS